MSPSRLLACLYVRPVLPFLATGGGHERTGGTMTDTDHLLSREQVATRLAVSVRSVRRYTESGRLPSVHVGRNVR